MVRGMRHCAIVIAALLMLPASAAWAQRVTEVFVPNQRIAEELLPVATAAIGSAGEAILDPHGNSLILIGPREVVDETLGLLRRQDRAAPAVRLRYRSLDLSELASVGLAIHWEVEAGVGVGRLSSASSVRGPGRLYRTKASRDFAGELRIQSGQTGHVGRGRSVPLESRDRFGRGVSGVAQAERGFSARPRVLGNGRIQVEFSSSDATVDDTGQIEFANSTTTLIVDAGETVVIGSLSRASRVKQGQGRSYSSRASEDKRIFLVTLDIESP